MTDHDSTRPFYAEAPREGLTTPNQMRAELARISRDDVLVRQVEDYARYSGLSGEDKYVVLAYHALIGRSRYLKLALDYLAREPRLHTITVPKDPP